MRRVLMTTIFVSFLTAICIANPLPEPLISEVSVDPPWIEILYWSDIEGEYIYTTNGAAQILEVEANDWEPIILDSSNTTGFTLNPDGDSIRFSFEHYFCYELGYGTKGELAGTPPPGHTIKNKMYEIWHGDGWSEILYYFSFSDNPSPEFWEFYWPDSPQWGSSKLIINELNFACDWRDGANFIELYNAGIEPVLTNNYSLVGDIIYDLPDGLVINPGEFYVIDEFDCPQLFCDKNRDVLYLIMLDYEIMDVVDQVGWSDAFAGNTGFMRFPDGNVDWSDDADFQGYSTETSYTFESGSPTRGAANRHECPGFVVIAARADSINDSAARISWTDPIWDGEFDYSVLVKTIDSYPETPADGEIIYEGMDQEYIDYDIIPSAPICYTVFACDNYGEYSIPTDESQTSISFNAVGIDDADMIPESYTTLECYPNPFNAQTTISFTLANAGQVEIAVYDITGRLIETLVEQVYPAGNHSIEWQADGLSSGIYFTRLQTGDLSQSRKLILLK